MTVLLTTHNLQMAALCSGTTLESSSLVLFCIDNISDFYYLFSFMKINFRNFNRLLLHQYAKTLILAEVKCSKVTLPDEHSATIQYDISGQFLTLNLISVLYRGHK